MTERKLLFMFGPSLVLFIIIALICVGFILAPVTVHSKVGDTEIIMAPAATSVAGMLARVEAWKEYPRYNIGLGIVSGLSFIGFLFSCYSMYSFKSEIQESEISPRIEN